MNWFYNLIRKTPTIPLDSSFSRVCLITGPTSGIGLETARLMYSRGFNLVLACRNTEKGLYVKNEFEKEISFPNNDRSPLIKVVEMDLVNMDSVVSGCVEFGNDFDRLDVLINNAGIWNGKSEQNKEGITAQGHSVTYQTNYLSHFLLSRLLIPHLINTSKITNKPGRIINVSSGTHAYATGEKKKSGSLNDLDWEKKMVNEHGDGFSSQAAQYFYVKLLQVMFANQLSRMYSEKEILSFSCHPGPIASNFYRDWPSLMKFFTKIETIPPMYGAFTSCYLATSEDQIVLKNNGNYFDNCALHKHHKLVDDIEQCELLWRRSEEQLASYLHSNTIQGQ